MQKNTRVVRLNDQGVPGSLLGTVLGYHGSRVVVEWDDGGFSSLSESRVIPHQKLKSWFKHGHKLYKKETRKEVIPNV